MNKPSKPSWADIKRRLSEFDRAGLLGLVQDLYATNKENQAFLHARFGLGDNLLNPYKIVVDRWLWPDVFKNQVTVAKAKKAISDYTKAIGRPEGLAEINDLPVFLQGSVDGRSIRGYESGRDVVP